MDIHNFDTIILSGGASRGYYQLGCLYRYQERISSVKRYIGTSVGAIICLLLCCDFPIDVIMKMSMKLSFSYPDWKEIAINLISKYGLADSNPYITSVTSMIRSKYGYIPTLLELENVTGKKLIVTASCVTTGELVYIDSNSFPSMPCTVAIDISSRVPYLFTPILWNGHLYVDGGLHEHFPISQRKDTERTLAIYTCGKNIGEVTSITDIHPVRYFWNLINSMTRGKYHDFKSSEYLTIHVISGWGGFMSASIEEAIGMFFLGMISMPQPPSPSVSEREE